MTGLTIAPPIMKSIGAIEWGDPTLRYHFATTRVLTVYVGLVVPSYVQTPPRTIGVAANGHSSLTCSGEHMVFSPAAIPVRTVVGLRSVVTDTTFYPMGSTIPIAATSSDPILS